MELAAVPAAVHAVLAGVVRHRGHEGVQSQPARLVARLHAAAPDAYQHRRLLSSVCHRAGSTATACMFTVMALYVVIN